MNYNYAYITPKREINGAMRGSLPSLFKPRALNPTISINERRVVHAEDSTVREGNHHRISTIPIGARVYLAYPTPRFTGVVGNADADTRTVRFHISVGAENIA